MYDAIFIGGGLNYAGAIVLARQGKKVVLIERDMKEFGGVCLHHGCIPSKNLLHRAKTIYELKEDVFTRDKDALNLKLLQENIRKNIQKSTQAITVQSKNAGVELIEDKGFVSDDGVLVNDKLLKTKHIIIGTGATPFIPNEIEIDGQRIVTSKEVLKIENLPQEIVIYGSGAIGLEFASFFAINGVNTTLVYRKDKISNKIHPKIVEKIEKQLKDIGIILKPNSSIISAKIINDKVNITFEDGEIIKSEMLLIATGRKPNIDVIKTKKIEVDNKIVTDEYFETTASNIYAIGDCNGKLKLAHAARAEVLNVVKNLYSRKTILNLDDVPKFIYTLPLSYAFVGNKGVKEAIFPLSYLGICGAVKGANLGEVILYSDEDGFISGAELFTPNAEELIGIISTALASEIDIKTFKKAVFPHPTFSESIDRVLRKF